MTATDPTPAAPGQHEAQALDTTASNYLDYAVEQYGLLAQAPPPMSTDVLIAALIGAGDETRAAGVGIRHLTNAVDRNTAVLERLEALLADQTAVLRAGLAEQAAAASTDRFGVEEAEDAIRAGEETNTPRAAAGG